MKVITDNMATMLSRILSELGNLACDWGHWRAYQKLMEWSVIVDRNHVVWEVLRKEI